MHYKKHAFVCFHRLDGKPEQVAELPPVSAATLTNEHVETSGALSSHSSPKPVVNSAATAGENSYPFTEGWR